VKQVLPLIFCTLAFLGGVSLFVNALATNKHFLSVEETNKTYAGQENQFKKFFDLPCPENITTQ
jgi:hypothetical protein